MRAPPLSIPCTKRHRVYSSIIIIIIINNNNNNIIIIIIIITATCLPALFLRGAAERGRMKDLDSGGQHVDPTGGACGSESSESTEP